MRAIVVADVARAAGEPPAPLLSGDRSVSPRPREFEEVGGAAVPIGHGHAADGVVVFLADAEGGGVDEFVADVDAVDDAEDEAVGADFLLKKEKGAAFTVPFSWSVVTQAIGRGTTRPARIG